MIFMAASGKTVAADYFILGEDVEINTGIGSGAGKDNVPAAISAGRAAT
ncbi:MAG TPA: hypothetical protein VHE81_07620 [Lacipirellulaceae bacterium]|nr:hypothetical protein [Lacipirellulaceae bacterium]